MKIVAIMINGITIKSGNLIYTCNLRDYDHFYFLIYTVE